MPQRAVVDGFTPATGGLHFPNSWPKVPAMSIRVMGGVRIPVGDASNGLCGGMVFAARDHFEAGTPVPTDTVAPSSGPLYEYVGDRLLDSFDLPNGPVRYYAWMAMPDADTRLAWFATLNHGVGWRTVSEELDRVTDEIDRGHPSCLGLVCARSTDPFELGQNHQVLAWKYRRTGAGGRRMTVWIYDPNQPDDNGARLAFDTTDPSDGIDIGFTGSSKKVRGFFRVPYSHKRPPHLA